MADYCEKDGYDHLVVAEVIQRFTHFCVYLADEVGRYSVYPGIWSPDVFTSCHLAEEAKQFAIVVFCSSEQRVVAHANLRHFWERVVAIQVIANGQIRDWWRHIEAFEQRQHGEKKYPHKDYMNPSKWQRSLNDQDKEYAKEVNERTNGSVHTSLSVIEVYDSTLSNDEYNFILGTLHKGLCAMTQNIKKIMKDVSGE